MKKRCQIYFLYKICILFLFCLLLENNSEINFQINFFYSINNDNLKYRREDMQTNVKQNIYNYNYYLNDLVRINTTFNAGTTYPVIYLNYPATAFASNNNSMKNTNGAGIIILSKQPSGILVSNLSTQSSIKPFAYFTLQEIPIGWQLYSPADYYTNKEPNSDGVTVFSIYNDNLYVGKKVGPIHFKADFNKDFIGEYIRSLGKLNIVIGNSSGNYVDGKLISYNVLVGNHSGKLISGSFNQMYGCYNMSTEELNTNYLTQDYYSDNDYSNYNNVFGFGSMGTTYVTAQGGKFIANKQNNIVGNLNFRAVWKGFRNCIFGNRIFNTIINNSILFNYVDSNISIGNDICYYHNNTILTNIWKNIWLIPSGSYDSGGINMQNVIQNNTCGSVMIGSCGGDAQYDRSYGTFIANIYDKGIVPNLPPLQTGANSLPQTVLVGVNDQLGTTQLLPYGFADNTALQQPGNVYNIDDIVEQELLTLPIIGIAFANTDKAKENGLLYTVDVDQIMNNKNNSIQRLSSFIVFHSAKKFSKALLSSQKSKKEIVELPKVSGYEHYYLIPLLVRAYQIVNEKIVSMQNKHKEIIKNFIMQNNALIQYLLDNSNNKENLEELLQNNLNLLTSIV